jgi:branched-chain amino acid aminotransferase
MRSGVLGLVRGTLFQHRYQTTRLSCTRLASSDGTFKASDLQIELCTEAQKKPKPDPDNLVFGKEFSDHMLEIDWSEKSGWTAPQITPLRNFSMHPAAKVYHYAVELFEGMKAFRGVDNKVRMFRPDCNVERMINTAARSALPTFDGAELIELLKKLLQIDAEWVPYSTTSSLYLRPTMIGTEPSLGVQKSNTAKLFVLTGPVGPYYPTGFKPVSLLADPQYVRAWEGGCGAYKMGSNYAPTIQIQIEAINKHDCQQVLWLYGPDHMLTEVGTMNIFMFWVNEQGERELVTPPLSSGLILPGVTRRSLLELTKSWGEFKVTERNFTMKDVLTALKEDRMKELFGAGTACVVSPVESIVFKGEKVHIPTMDDGAPITMRLYKELTDIQYGRTPHPWSVPIE